MVSCLIRRNRHTGECAQYAAAIPVTKLVMPGTVLRDAHAVLAG
jgi:hypothetical protein